MHRRVLPWLLYAAAAIDAGVRLARFPPWTVDDAYIVFRYARHLVDHGQLAFNLGAPPVEGTTGIALPLLVAGGLRAGLAPRTTTWIAGVAGLALAGVTLRDNQRLLGVREPARAYVTACALLVPALVAHATSGLETMLFAGSLSASFGMFLRAWVRPRATVHGALWVTLFALSLVRPEGVLCAAAFGGLLGWGVAGRRRPGEAARLAGVAVAAYALHYAGYAAWRLHAYGRLLPNTYYAKLADRLRPDFVRDGAQLVGVFLPALVAGAILALAARRVRLPRAAGVAVLAIVAVATAEYSRSALVMGYLYRFQVHFLFLLLPLLGVLLSRMTDLPRLAPSLGPAKGTLLAIAAGACLIALPASLAASADSVRAQAQRYLDVETDQHARIGAWLRDHLAPDEAIACWVDAGLIPYIAIDHPVIDFGRLNDAELSRPGTTPTQMADVFFARRPGALVVTSASPVAIVPEHDGGAVTSDPRFAAYAPAKSFCSPEHPEAPCEVLFLRRDLRLR